MIIEYEWQSYNHRRYGTPWAAIITFDGVKPVYEFTGRFASGKLRFEAEEGDIVACGQKDLRGNNTQKDFYITRDGDIHWLKGGEGEAFELWRARQTDGDAVTVAQLQAVLRMIAQNAAGAQAMTADQARFTLERIESLAKAASA